jgi:hypothetical protein
MWPRLAQTLGISHEISSTAGNLSVRGLGMDSFAGQTEIFAKMGFINRILL